MAVIQTQTRPMMTPPVETITNDKKAWRKSSEMRFSVPILAIEASEW